MLANINLTAFSDNAAAGISSNKISKSGAVIVTDSGIYINGIYYSQAQFFKLLSTSQEV